MTGGTSDHRLRPFPPRFTRWSLTKRQNCSAAGGSAASRTRSTETVLRTSHPRSGILTSLPLSRSPETTFRLIAAMPYPFFTACTSASIDGNPRRRRGTMLDRAKPVSDEAHVAAPFSSEIQVSLSRLSREGFRGTSPGLPTMTTSYSRSYSASISGASTVPATKPSSARWERSCSTACGAVPICMVMSTPGCAC